MQSASVRTVPALVILVTLLVLAGVILFTYLRLRSAVREQISRRDAQVLRALWLTERANDRTLAIAPVTDASDYLVPLLQTNQFRQLPSVKGTRLFDPAGRQLIAFPDDLPDAELTGVDMATLHDLGTTSRFIPNARQSALSMFADPKDAGRTLPLLEILLPLHPPGETRLLGVAQFLFDGSSIAAELKALDLNLAAQAVATFLAVGLVLAVVLGAAFRRLQRANSLLEQRTLSLLHANQELAIAAKTSAIGAVTAHLIHGLKNPLAGLQIFMSGRQSPDGAESGEEWREAVSTTRRMQTLINETVRVLREQEGVAEYELSLEEIAGLISSKVRPLAGRKGVAFSVELSAKAHLNNRTANLIILILENLITNGVQATPAGRAVVLDISGAPDSVVCRVRDQGSGLPEHMREGLFKPCTSTKEGGSGIGLSISKHLANSIGAELELASTSASGSVFTLRLPLNVFPEPAGIHSESSGIASPVQTNTR
jgi:signal transduction histidine kinase